MIDDVRRDISNVVSSDDDSILCDGDDNLTTGWYRFLLEGQDAVVPNYCVPVSVFSFAVDVVDIAC